MRPIDRPPDLLQKFTVIVVLPMLVFLMFAFLKVSDVHVQIAEVVEQSQSVNEPSIVYVDHIAVEINPRRFNPRDPEKTSMTLEDLRQEAVKQDTAHQGKKPSTSYEQPSLPDSFWKQDANSDFYFRFDVSQPEYCEDDDKSNNNNDVIIIMVPSAHKNTAKRDKIRSTWGKTMKKHGFLVKTIFLLGETKNSQLNENVYREARKTQDIVIANFTDTYRNLSYKTLSGLNWVKSFCPQARMVVKLDDDVKTFIHMRLINFIQNRMKQKDFIKSEIWCSGGLFNKPRPIRAVKSKWHAPLEIYPEKFYPKLCLGSYGYVITMQGIKDIIEVSHRTKFFWLEDVYVTGILRQLANITIGNLPR